MRVNRAKEFISQRVDMIYDEVVTSRYIEFNCKVGGDEVIYRVYGDGDGIPFTITEK